MIALKELCTFLEELLQASKFVDGCKNGLQVEGSAEIFKIATAVTASRETIEAAALGNFNALIVHHGLFWNQEGHVIAGVKREKLNLLLKHDISLLAYHLPLDAHQELGNNWKAAREMGWMNLQPFGLMNGLAIGVRGTIGFQSQIQFKNTLEKYYQHPAHCALGGKDSIETAALISGGAYRNIADAISEGVDAYVTGNFDEPVWHQAFEENINFFALGHSATERIGPRALGDYLKKTLDVEVHFLDFLNPF